METAEEAEAAEGDAGSDPERRKPRNYWIVSIRGRGPSGEGKHHAL
jgi:hypothetical protein